MADGAPASDPRTLFHRSFAAPSQEHGFRALRTTGAWPEALRGTLYRNGPGRFSNQGHRYRHWFDGDGLVTALRVDGSGRAEGAIHLLETPGLLEEEARGRAHFGGYGTRAPGFFNPLRALRMTKGGGKNPANTAMLAWSERVFALCEAGLPLEIDPDTLASRGETDLGGAIPMRFSAHPHRRAVDGSHVNMGLRISRPSELDLMLLRPDGSAGKLTSFVLPYPTMVHDFALTERYAIVFLAPLHIELLPLLFGRKAFVDAHQWKTNAPTEVVVFPLDAPGSPKRFPIDPFWAWHTANAFDDGAQIVVDLVRHEDYPRSQGWLGSILTEGRPKGAPSGQLARLRLDPQRGRASTELVRHRTGEFPRVAPAVDGRRHRFVHLLEHPDEASAQLEPPSALVSVDLDSGVARSFVMAPHEFPAEAVFVPHPEGGDAEDRGWLLTLVYDGLSHRSHFALFDAQQLDDGPIACAHLETHVPLGFHGTWVSSR